MFNENISDCGVTQLVNPIRSDSSQAADLYADGSLDFVFIDAVKQDYFEYFQLIESKLKPGAVIVADNVIISAEAMKDYLDYVQKSPDYDTVIIRASDEKKDGMAISYKIR